MVLQPWSATQHLFQVSSKWKSGRQGSTVVVLTGDVALFQASQHYHPMLEKHSGSSKGGPQLYLLPQPPFSQSMVLPFPSGCVNVDFNGGVCCNPSPAFLRVGAFPGKRSSMDYQARRDLSGHSSLWHSSLWLPAKWRSQRLSRWAPLQTAAWKRKK